MLTPIQNGRIQGPPTLHSTELVPVETIDKRDSRRQLFERSLHSSLPKSLYQQVTRLVSHFLQQIMGREQEEGSRSKRGLVDLSTDQAQPTTREVRGIADRMPRLVDPENPFPHKDLVLLGEAKDYPAAVIAIQFDNQTKPVFYEGNQVVARSLYLDSTKPAIDGQLVLADGSRLPIHIRIITAI